jgi:hypothetical protein
MVVEAEMDAATGTRDVDVVGTGHSSTSMPGRGRGTKGWDGGRMHTRPFKKQRGPEPSGRKGGKKTWRQGFSPRMRGSPGGHGG